jgi:hypothetical protein
MAGARKGGRALLLRLASGLFFLLQLFFPELETDEKEIRKRNPEKKGAGARVDHLPLPSNRSMDELSCEGS